MSQKVLSGVVGLVGWAVIEIKLISELMGRGVFSISDF
jgi:hypothetical protein